jgi:sugar/nucleoside kinase (ribokinase family)
VSSRLLVVGSVALDTIETRAGRREEILGGSATYISLAASSFCPANLVAVVGADDFRDEHVDLLGARGVDTEGLERAPGRTFRWSGVYKEDFSSRTTLDTQLGVFESFSPKIPSKYLPSDFAILGNIQPDLQLKVLDAIGHDAFVAADTMNYWINNTPEKLKEVISRIDLLIINDEEARDLTGEYQVMLAAKELLKKGPKALIVKRGEHGAYLFAEGLTFFAPAMPLEEVIDPTGAGDTFAGGLMGFLAGCADTGAESLKKGMIYGAASASAAVEGFGVEKLAALDREALDRRYARLRSLVDVG